MSSLNMQHKQHKTKKSGGGGGGIPHAPFSGTPVDIQSHNSQIHNAITFKFLLTALHLWTFISLFLIKKKLFDKKKEKKKKTNNNNNTGVGEEPHIREDQRCR